MNSQCDEGQHQFLLKVFADTYDQSYVPIWGGYWSDYSGCGWIVILDKDGQLYELDYCYSPEIGNDEPKWYPVEVTYDQAIQTLIDWEHHLE
jgi:hypothetical protein